MSEAFGGHEISIEFQWKYLYEFENYSGAIIQKYADIFLRSSPVPDPFSYGLMVCGF